MVEQQNQEIILDIGRRIWSSRDKKSSIKKTYLFEGGQKNLGLDDIRSRFTVKTKLEI
jgi:hypothetical protein